MTTLKDTAIYNPRRGSTKYTTSQREAIIAEIHSLMDEGFNFWAACKLAGVAGSTARGWGVDRTGGDRNEWRTPAYGVTHPRFWITMAYYGTPRELDEEYETRDQAANAT